MIVRADRIARSFGVSSVAGNVSKHDDAGLALAPELVQGFSLAKGATFSLRTSYMYVYSSVGTPRSSNSMPNVQSLSVIADLRNLFGAVTPLLKVMLWPMVSDMVQLGEEVL